MKKAQTRHKIIVKILPDRPRKRWLNVQDQDTRSNGCVLNTADPFSYFFRITKSLSEIFALPLQFLDALVDKYDFSGIVFWMPFSATKAFLSLVLSWLHPFTHKRPGNFVNLKPASMNPYLFSYYWSSWQCKYQQPFELQFKGVSRLTFMFRASRRACLWRRWLVCTGFVASWHRKCFRNSLKGDNSLSKHSFLGASIGRLFL